MSEVRTNGASLGFEKNSGAWPTKCVAPTKEQVLKEYEKLKARGLEGEILEMLKKVTA